MTSQTLYLRVLLERGTTSWLGLSHCVDILVLQCASQRALSYDFNSLMCIHNVCMILCRNHLFNFCPRLIFFVFPCMIGPTIPASFLLSSFFTFGGKHSSMFILINTFLRHFLPDFIWYLAFIIYWLIYKPLQVYIPICFVQSSRGWLNFLGFGR